MSLQDRHGKSTVTSQEGVRVLATALTFLQMLVYQDRHFYQVLRGDCLLVYQHVGSELPTALFTELGFVSSSSSSPWRSSGFPMFYLVITI